MLIKCYAKFTTSRLSWAVPQSWPSEGAQTVELTWGNTMKPRFAIIAGAALIAILVSSGMWQANRLSDVARFLSAEQARNAKLQDEVARLEKTSLYFLRRGVDMQSAGNLTEARAAFEAVVSKFPTSDLARTARQRLAIVNAAIARAEADRVAEERRRQEKREELERLRGAALHGVHP